METAMQELPLAFFTTLAPIGAGAFIALALAYAATTFSDDQLKKIDKMTLIPFFMVVVGFIASFAHLANPVHAAGVFAHIGISPLSNEIAMGFVFFVPAVVFGIMAFAGKLNTGTRKVFSIIVAALAILFACCTGMAYYVDTIPSWATPATPVSVIGFCLMGGVILGSLVLALAGALDDAIKTSFKRNALIVAIVGLILGVGGACAQFGAASGITTSAANGAQIASAVGGYLGGFIVLAIAGMAIGIYALLKKPSTSLVACSAIAIVIAVFLARLVFYALEISVGL